MLTRILILLFIFLISCGLFQSEKNRYISLAHQVIDENVAHMYQTFGMYSFATGGGFCKQVNELHISLDLPQETGIKLARRYIIHGTQDALLRINRIEEIRPHLNNDPFQVGDIYYKISFVNKNFSWITQKSELLDKERLTSVNSYNGRVFYSVRYDDKPCYHEINEEPYEEALKIVKRDYPEDFQDLGN